MRRNTFEVVAEQRRDDWIAEFFLEQVERCLASEPNWGLDREQARERLMSVANFVEGQGWPVRWTGGAHDELQGLTLNNGGVAVVMRRKRRPAHEPALYEARTDMRC